MPQNPLRVKIKNNIIVSRFCGECQEWLDISNFGIIKDGKNQKLWHKCEPCRYEFQSIQNQRRREGGGKKSRFEVGDRNSLHVTRIKIIDGLEYLDCNFCKEVKSVIDFIKRRGKTHPHCLDCQRKRNKFDRTIRRCRKRFGDNSPELRTLLGEGWKGNFQEVSRMLEVQAYQHVLDNKKLKPVQSEAIRAPMRRLFGKLSSGMEKQKGGAVDSR